MANKLRGVMGKRDNEYQLSEQIELYDAFFSTEIPQDQKNKQTFKKSAWELMQK